MVFPRNMASTSAAAASQSIVLEELNNLFSWNPRRLKLLPCMLSGKPSTTTRKTAFFDLHFSAKLALKRIVHLPSLLKDLEKTVDSALDDAKHTLPALPPFLAGEARRGTVLSVPNLVRDEKGVSSFYSRTTGLYCPIVASALALHPTSWTSLIYWTDSVSSSKYAISDGELAFWPADHDTEEGQSREAIVNAIEIGRREILKAMRDKQKPLMTYKFRSLSAGPVEVMTAIPELGDFEWTYCGSPKHPCSDPQHDKAKDQVAIIVPGPDALCPPWDIGVCSYIASSTMSMACL